VREAQALARLSRANVVQVYEIGERDGQAFLAMEIVDGVTRRTWLRTSPRSRAEILAVFTAAGRGLAAAHAKGLVHRDFRPDNVMIANDGRVLVMDFGLAQGFPRTSTMLGRYDDAMASFRAAKDHWEAADVELAQGHPDQAERHLVRAIPLMAATLEALAALERALPVIEHSYGPDDPDIGINLWGQAESYAAKGELERARELASDALELLRAAESPYLAEAEAWVDGLP
jgi:serine/threonine protein kinase